MLRKDDFTCRSRREHVFSKHTLVIHTVFSFLLTISVTKSSLQILIKTPSRSISLTSLVNRSISGISHIFVGERDRFSSIFAHSGMFLSLSHTFVKRYRLFFSLTGYVLAWYVNTNYKTSLLSRYSIILLRVYVPFWQMFPSKTRRLTHLSWMRQFLFFSPFAFVHSQHLVKKYSWQWYKIVMPYLCSHL